MNVLTNILGYPLTYIELFGVIAYFISVYLAVKVNVWTWATGIVSSILFFILYLNTHTYANGLLQIILIIVSIDGWKKWGRTDNKKVSILNWKNRFYVFMIILISIILFGTIINLFSSDPYPYLDVSIFVLSIVGVILLANKKIESWYIWILVNICTIILYSLLGFYLIGIQSLIFIFMDFIALKEWRKKCQSL
jgi:nicotinamide mononucleotide transporter